MAMIRVLRAAMLLTLLAACASGMKGRERQQRVEAQKRADARGRLRRRLNKRNSAEAETRMDQQLARNSRTIAQGTTPGGLQMTHIDTSTNIDPQLSTYLRQSELASAQLPPESNDPVPDGELHALTEHPLSPPLIHRDADGRPLRNEKDQVELSWDAEATSAWIARVPVPDSGRMQILMNLGGTDWMPLGPAVPLKVCRDGRLDKYPLRLTLSGIARGCILFTVVKDVYLQGSYVRQWTSVARSQMFALDHIAELAHKYTRAQLSDAVYNHSINTLLSRSRVALRAASATTTPSSPEPAVELPEDPARRVLEARATLAGCDEAWSDTVQTLEEMKTRLGTCRSGRDIDWDKVQTIVNIIARLEVKLARIRHKATSYVTLLRQVDPALAERLCREEAPSPQTPEEGGAPEVDDTLQDQEETKEGCLQGEAQGSGHILEEIYGR